MLSLPSYATLAAAVLVAYFIGGLPFGYWFVRFSSGRDIRTMGSGNIGATNVHRTLGGKAGLIVLALDILKGWAAVWIGALISHGDPAALAASALAVMIGHCYPALLHFHGGKAVACFIGAFLYLAPLSLGVAAVVFIAVVALTRYISLGSIAGALVFPFAVGLLGQRGMPILLASIGAALLIVYRHKSNIGRLRAGSERVFSLKGGGAE